MSCLRDCPLSFMVILFHRPQNVVFYGTRRSMIHFTTTKTGPFSTHSSSKNAWQVFLSWMRRRLRHSRRRWMTGRRTQANLRNRRLSRVQGQVRNNLEKCFRTGSHTVGLGGLAAYYLANDPPRHLMWPNHCHSPSSLQEKAVACPNRVRQMIKDRLWMTLILRS